MDAFPDNLEEAIQARVNVQAEKKKQQWMAKYRERIFEGLVRTAEDQQPIYSFLLEPGHFSWHAELCAELVVKHDLDVRIFIRTSSATNADAGASGTDARSTRELLFEQWDQIHKLDVRQDIHDKFTSSHCRKFQAFCKIKTTK